MADILDNLKDLLEKTGLDDVLSDALGGSLGDAVENALEGAAGGKSGKSTSAVARKTGRQKSSAAKPKRRKAGARK